MSDFKLPGPAEIQIHILGFLVLERKSATSRHTLLTSESIAWISGARLVCKYFKNCCNDMFRRVLEEKPFVRKGMEIEGLEKLSLRPEWANYMKTLSLCTMTWNWPTQELWNRSFKSYLADILRRFPRLVELRCYPVSPKCMSRKWPYITKENGRIYERDIDFREDALTIGDPYGDPGKIINFLFDAFNKAGIKLKTMSMPFFKNHQYMSHMRLLSDEGKLNLKNWPKTIRKLCLNLDSYSFNAFIKSTKHQKTVFDELEIMDIAISKTANETSVISYHGWSMLLSSQEAEPVPNFPNLKEFYLAAGEGLWFKIFSTENTLGLSPSLKRLGLANIKFSKSDSNGEDRGWNTMVKDATECRELESMWLLNPRQKEYNHSVVEETFVPEEGMKTTFKLKVIHNKYPFKLNVVNVKEFPGFAFFEEDFIMTEEEKKDFEIHSITSISGSQYQHSLLNNAL